MEFRFTKEEEEFRQEVREFLLPQSELLEKVRQESESGGGWGPWTREFLQKAGARGYLTPSWPKKYGGLGASHMKRYIAAEEMSYFAGRSAQGVGMSMAGPVVLLFGSDEQKEEYLPRIARGEIEFTLGYTEPHAGSDLASLEIHAVKDGDYYIMNGQKVFNSGAHYSQYHWLAARTDTTVRKHHGISMFIVNLDSPGITIRPLIGLSGYRTNEIFYNDVKVPKERLVGEENKGWQYLAMALAHERTYLAGGNISDFERLLDYIRTTKRGGKAIAADPLVRNKVAQFAIDLEVTRLLGLRVACMIDKGTLPTYEASMAKLFGSEMQYRMTDEWVKCLSLYGQLGAGSKWAVMDGDVNRLYYTNGIRDLLTRGTSEIMRNIIALLGLGLPRE